MRDLADGRELVLADHDPVPPAVEGQCRDERARRETEVVTAASSASAWSRRAIAERNALVPFDPEVPLGAVRVPAGELLLDGIADAMRQRPASTS